MAHAWVRHVIDDFEHNPKTMYRFHLAAMWFWVANAAAGTAVMVLFPHLWVTVGVFYVFLLSIYANWDTDLDSLAACMAAMHGETILDEQRKAKTSGG